jgi:50S ribosomal subunit-associated GTPase HflX
LENDYYKLYFDRTVLNDIHIQHNRPDIIILNKQQKQAYLLDITVPNSHNISQTYNTKINKFFDEIKDVLIPDEEPPELRLPSDRANY